MSEDVPESEAEQSSIQFSTTDQLLCRPWWRYAGICILMIIAFSALDEIGAILSDEKSDGPGAVGALCVLLTCCFLCLGLFVRVRRPHLIPHISSEIRGFTRNLCIAVVATKLLSVIGCFGQSPELVAHQFGSGYSIRVPPAFVETKDGNVPNGLALSDIGNELHLQVSSIPKIDLTARTIEEVAQLGLQSQQAALTNVTAGSPDVETRRGRLHANTVLRGSAEGINLVFVMRHIDFGNDWVEVRMWTTASRYDMYRDMFRAMANRVKKDDE